MMVAAAPAPGLAGGPDVELARALIRDVIDRRAVIMHFQPVVLVNSLEAVGLQALARFTVDPNRGPASWFRQADRVGMGIDLDLLAAETATEALALLDEVFVSIKVSPETATTTDLVYLIAQQQTRVVIDICDRQLSRKADHITAAVTALRLADLRVAVTFAGRHADTLIAMHPDIIKLDAGVVRAINHNDRRLRAVATLASLAKDNGIVTIADGVETQEELAALRTTDIDLVQGYLIGRPRPL